MFPLVFYKYNFFVFMSSEFDFLIFVKCIPFLPTLSYANFKIFWPLLTESHILKIIFNIQLLNLIYILCDHSMLYWATMSFVICLLLLKTMLVSHRTTPFFAINFCPQSHFSLEMFWHRCISTSRTIPTIMSNTKLPKSLFPHKWAKCNDHRGFWTVN